MDRHGVRPDPQAVEAVLTWKAPRMDTAHELPRVCQLLPGVHKRICGQGVSDAEADAQQRKKFERNDEAEVTSENIKRELCEAPVLGMPTKKGMYVLDTDEIGSSHLRNIASGARMEWKNGSPSHCIRQQGLE